MENRNCTRYIKPCINIDKDTKYRKKAYRRMFAILTAFSIYSSIFPCTTHTSYAAVTEGDNVTDEMEESLPLEAGEERVGNGVCGWGVIVYPLLQIFPDAR